MVNDVISLVGLIFTSTLYLFELENRETVPNILMTLINYTGRKIRLCVNLLNYASFPFY